MQRQDIMLWMDREDITSSRDYMLWVSEQGCSGCSWFQLQRAESCMQFIMAYQLETYAWLGTCGLCLWLVLVAACNRLWLAYPHQPTPI
jgi:hypothetical protein